MAKNRTEVGNFGQKVIYFHVSNLQNLLLHFFQHFLFFLIAKAQLDATFP